MKSANYVFDKTVVLLLKQIMRVVAYFVPRRRDLVVLGAWSGDRYADNPKFLAQYLLDNSGLQLVWIGKASAKDMLPPHPRLGFAEMGSRKAFWSLLRAKTWICCISIEWDLTTWPIEGFATVINTWHGFGIKRGGNKTGALAHSGVKASLAGRIVKFLELHKRPWLMVACEHNIGHLLGVSPEYFRTDRILRIGTPVADYLLDDAHRAERVRQIREAYEQELGIPRDAKIVTYLPTWRNTGVKVFSFYGLPNDGQENWRKMLSSHNAVIVEKHHPRTLIENPMVGESKCSIPISLEMQKRIEVYDLLLVTDVLISDCSGAYKDFALQKRPCIHFMYDFDDYENNCSGYVDGWREMLAGPMVMDEAGLLETVEQSLLHPVFEPAPGYAKMVEYQHGNACKDVLSIVKG